MIIGFFTGIGIGVGFALVIGMMTLVVRSTDSKRHANMLDAMYVRNKIAASAVAELKRIANAIDTADGNG